MQKRKILSFITFLVSLCGLWLTQPQHLYAGIYNSDTDVIYKEYWLPHSQFTGGYVDYNNILCQNTSGGGDWYFEPWPFPCMKTVTLNIPDSLTKATKAEIYLDLWRNHDLKVARFSINGSDKVYTPSVGSEWSRTPYIGEIPVAELKQGNNIFKFWDAGGGYHIHDMAIRLYFAAGDITAPAGELLTVGGIAAASGGVLDVDNDKVVLVAKTTTAAKFIEFHAYYEGYDEDADGITRDWHNRARNNWQVGGTLAQALGGTIDHIGTIAAPTAGEYSFTWNLPHIVNQSGVKFKIRIVDSSGSVREAAGGISGNFTLKRTKRMIAFSIPNYRDAVLHHSQTNVAQYPDVITRTVDIPVNISGYNTGYVLGSYWQNPKVALNGNPAFSSSNGEDIWTLSVREKPISQFRNGANNIVYSYNGGFGQFVENPGPMIVLKQTTSTTDNIPPTLANQTPAPNAPTVPPSSPIIFHITDAGLGVDRMSIKLRVNGAVVAPEISGFSNDYLVYYVAPTGLAPEAPITVAVDACDLALQCVTNQQYSFTTTGLDTVAPVIVNPTCIVGPNRATIAWDTNEQTTGLVKYGTSAAYGSEAVASTLAFNHQIPLTGLDANSIIHYQISATDTSSNTATTADAVCPALEVSALVSDDFNTCAIDPARWTYTDPQAGTAGATTLQHINNTVVLSVPGGTAHDIWTGGIGAARLMQTTTNADFSIDVKFESALTQGFQLQGLLVQQDNLNFIRVNFQSNDDSSVTLEGFSFANGTPYAAAHATLANGNGPMYLRLNRNGTQWQLFYSTNGSDWISGGTFLYALNVSSVGFFAGNAGLSPAHTAVIDYFFNGASPIVPEDGKALTLTGLNVSPAGAGIAASVPVTPTAGAPANCGNPIRLTATPIPGWSFVQWESTKGSVSGTSNPLQTGYTFNEVVTAKFAQDQYSLSTETVGNGTIDVSPLQATYLYSDVVTLTATPAMGWSFGGWSGASTADTLATTVTITADTVVTATFVANEYTLTVNTAGDGSGTTTVTPLQATYLYSDVVTLSAEAAPGSTFTGWSGAIVSGQPTETVTITGDTVVTATFAEEAYTLDVTVVTNNVESSNTEAGGTVAVTPEKAFYGFNEQVGLVATPKPGWIFAGWSGATTESATSITLTMTENKSITATFTQEQYTLTRNKGGQGSGSIKVTPDRASYLFGEVVSVEAIADTGSLFAGWSGDLAGTVATKTLTITDDSTVLATFDREEYQVHVTVLGGQDGEVGGTVTISPDGPYYFNSKVTLTAVPNSGYEFDHWSSEPAEEASSAQIGADTDPVLVITVTDDVLYFANFTKSAVPVNEPKIFIPFVSR